MATVLVCLFLVNDIAFAAPFLESSRSVLAPPLATKPPCEIVKNPNGSFDVITNSDVIGSWDKETVRSYRQGVTASGKSFRNRWAFVDVSCLIGQMLILTQEHKLQNPKEILIPLIKKHIRNRNGKTEILLEGFNIDEIEEVREGGEIIGFSLPVTRNNSPAYRLVYNLQGGDTTIPLSDGARVYVKVVFSEKEPATAGNISEVQKTVLQTMAAKSEPGKNTPPATRLPFGPAAIESAIDNREIAKLLNESLFSHNKEIKNRSLYMLMHLYNSNEHSFLEAWQSIKLNPDTKAVIKRAEDNGVLDRIQNNVLRKILRFEESMQEKMRTSQAEAQTWSDNARKNVAQGKVRALMILTAPPNKGAGSAVVLKEILKEHNSRGNDCYVSVADYRKVQAEELGLSEGRNIDTIVFKNPEKHQEVSVDVFFPIPTYSKGMPFPHTRFKDLDDVQLIEFLEAYSEHLERIIRDFKPDIIHTNHLFLLNPLVKVIAPWIPVVCTTHGTEEKMLREDDHLAPLVIPGTQAVEKIFSISPAVTAEVQAIYGVDSNRIILTKNGYDSSIFHPKNIFRRDLLEKYSIKGNFARVVLYVGKYADWKGIDYLIESATRYSKNKKTGPVLTLIVGNGPEALKVKYQDRINEFGLEGCVKLIGEVPHEEISNFMNIADTFVLPSLSEPFGLSLLEALGCGCRIVSTDQGGPPSFVPQELQKEGLATLVESLHVTEKHAIQTDDVTSFINRLSTAIVRMLQNETSFSDRERISATVRHMRWSSVYEKINAAYQEVIAERLKSFFQAEPPAIAFFDNVDTSVSNVEFHPSALCNLRCKGCTYYLQHGKGMFPFGHLDRIAILHPDEIIIAGGGEPVLYNDNGMTFNELILKLKELRPDTKIRLVTNGTFIPKGEWQSMISSLKVSMYGFNRQQYIDYAGRDVFEKVWNNIFDNYLSGPIPHITISPLVQKKDYQYVPDFVELVWNQWQRYKKQGLIPHGKKLEIALTPFADDTSMSNPYAPSNPDDFTQESWRKSWDIKEKSNTPFGEFLLQQSKKSARERAENDFILSEEIFDKTLPVRVVEGATKCVHPAGYVLVNPKEEVYPCFLMGVRKEAALGNITMSPEDLLTQRKQIMDNPPKVCAEGCRVPLTRCGKIVLDMIRKRSQVEAATKLITASLDQRSYITPESERIYAINFQDAVNYIQAQPQTQPIIVALGTSWIKGYEKGRYLQYDALNPLIGSLRTYCESKGIPFIVDRDDKILARIKAERAKDGRSGAKVVVLAGKDTVTSDEFATLRNDEKNAFVVGVDNQELTTDSYIRLMEMLTLALKLSAGLEVSLDNAHVTITKDNKHHLYIFLPHAEPMDYERLKVIYEVQKFA